MEQGEKKRRVVRRGRIGGTGREKEKEREREREEEGERERETVARHWLAEGACDGGFGNCYQGR